MPWRWECGRDACEKAVVINYSAAVRFATNGHGGLMDCRCGFCRGTACRASLRGAAKRKRRERSGLSPWAATRFTRIVKERERLTRFVGRFERSPILNLRSQKKRWPCW